MTKTKKKTSGITPRLPVAAFALLMEMKLRRHDATRGTSGWINESPDWLLSRLVEEVGELAKAIREGHHRKTVSEATDVANFAMMIVDVLTRQ